MQRYDWPGESADSDGKQQSSFSTERERDGWGGEKDFTKLHHNQPSHLDSYRMKFFDLCFFLFSFVANIIM